MSGDKDKLGGRRENRDKLTLDSIDVRTVSVPMRRPIISKVGEYPEWPFILIDVKTKEGIVGRSYPEPYLHNASRYIVPAISASRPGMSLSRRVEAGLRPARRFSVAVIEPRATAAKIPFGG